MMDPEERLAYMANQIARNLKAQGDDAAARAVADHIGAFWEPRMKTRLFAMAPDRLDPIVVHAIDLLQASAAAPEHTLATVFEGGSDAG